MANAIHQMTPKHPIEKQRPPKSLFHGFSDPFERIQEEMNRVLAWPPRGWDFPLGFTGWNEGAPFARLDLSETPEFVQIVADMPGIREKDIDVTLYDNYLVLAGKRESEMDEKQKNYHRVERSFGAFQRRVALPCEVDPNRVDAKLKDGVLTVMLPKSERALEHERKIQVKAA